MKKVFYLYKSGILKCQDYSLILETKTSVDYIPIEQLDTIICFSEVTLNKRCLSLLNKKKISILFYNFYGNYIGRFTPKEYINGKILLEQVHAYEDFDKRLYIAKTILKGSLHNMLSLVKYYRKKEKEVNGIIDELGKYDSEIVDCSSIESLLLIEAKAKQFYYKLFDIVINGEDFMFEKRTKNPPENEVNAMISYGYAILYGIYLAILDRSSLFPQISFIHSLSKNSDSLQFDLADVMKPILVDRLVLRLIRKKQITKSHFDWKDNKACFLNNYGIKVFMKEFDILMQSTIDYHGKRYSYRSLISKEIHQLSEYLKGNLKTMHPFILKW